MWDGKKGDAQGGITNNYNYYDTTGWGKVIHSEQCNTNWNLTIL